MADIAAIRRALREAVEDGLSSFGGSVRVVPAIDEFDNGSRGFDYLGFAVSVTTGPVEDPASEDGLDALLDPDGGVRVLLEGDRKLGGLVSDTVVTRCSGYQTFPVRGDAHPSLLGATWTVRCMV